MWVQAKCLEMCLTLNIIFTSYIRISGTVEHALATAFKIGYIEGALYDPVGEPS